MFSNGIAACVRLLADALVSGLTLPSLLACRYTLLVLIFVGRAASASIGRAGMSYSGVVAARLSWRRA